MLDRSKLRRLQRCIYPPKTPNQACNGGGRPHPYRERDPGLSALRLLDYERCDQAMPREFDTRIVNLRKSTLENVTLMWSLHVRIPVQISPLGRSTLHINQSFRIPHMKTDFLHLPHSSSNAPSESAGRYVLDKLSRAYDTQRRTTVAQSLKDDKVARSFQRHVRSDPAYAHVCACTPIANTEKQ